MSPVPRTYAAKICIDTFAAVCKYYGDRRGVSYVALNNA